MEKAKADTGVLERVLTKLLDHESRPKKRQQSVAAAAVATTKIQPDQS